MTTPAESKAGQREAWGCGFAVGSGQLVHMPGEMQLTGTRRFKRSSRVKRVRRPRVQGELNGGKSGEDQKDRVPGWWGQELGLSSSVRYVRFEDDQVRSITAFFPFKAHSSTMYVHTYN